MAKVPVRNTCKNGWEKKSKRRVCVHIPMCVVGTHVDDLFPLCNEEGVMMIDKILRELRSHVEIEDEGEIAYALDTRVECDREKGELRISRNT